MSYSGVPNKMAASSKLSLPQKAERFDKNSCNILLYPYTSLAIYRSNVSYKIHSRGTHLENTWLEVYLKDNIYRYIVTAKVLKHKTCKIPRQRVIWDKSCAKNVKCRIQQ